jgi:hypothetical protein
MPTSLARVLAEAARDFRTGRPVYLVATLRFPQYVVGAYPTRAEADSVAADSGSGYGAFGPYVTPRDEVKPNAVTVDSVVVYLRTSGGSRRLKVSPNVDALFLTPAAMDKFLVPYYAGLYGPEVANLLREQAMIQIRPPCHWAGSIPCATVWGFPSLLPPPHGVFPPGLLPGDSGLVRPY